MNVKRQHFCATQFLMVRFGLGGHVRWEGRPIEERFPGCRNHPPLHTLPSTPVPQTPRITCNAHFLSLFALFQSAFSKFCCAKKKSLASIRPAGRPLESAV